MFRFSHFPQASWTVVVPLPPFGLFALFRCFQQLLWVPPAAQLRRCDAEAGPSTVQGSGHEEGAKRGTRSHLQRPWPWEPPPRAEPSVESMHCRNAVVELPGQHELGTDYRERVFTKCLVPNNPQQLPMRSSHVQPVQPIGKAK